MCKVESDVFISSLALSSERVVS